MGRGLKIVTMLTMCMVLVAGLVLAGCGREAVADLEKPSIEFTQYLRGATVDFDDATLNQMAEGGGEPGFKFGLAASLYPSKFTQEIRDQWANQVFPPPYKVLKTPEQADKTTFDMLDGGDQSAVNGAIYANVLTQAERDVVETLVLPGFFNRVDLDMSDGVPPNETSAYDILKGVSTSAANAWVADVADEKDYADRFFVHLVKEYVSQYPTMFLPFWTMVDPNIQTVGDIPDEPTTEQVEAVARLAGESGFTNGTAGTMHPEAREAKAQAMHGVSYAELTEQQAPFVDAAVYQSLPSAFGNMTDPDFWNDVNDARDAAANELAGFPYAFLPGTAQAGINQYVFSQLDNALEWDYITFASVPGAVMGWGAEMADEKPLNQNQAYQALNASVSYTAAEGWKAAVEAGVHPRQAFYRWLALEAVRGMAAANTMIRMCIGEYAFKVKNPNDYDISLDRIDFTAQVEVNETMVDVAKLSLGDRVFIPANSEINIALNAPTKNMDVLIWQVVAGVDSATAGMNAALAWAQIKGGTAEIDVTLDVTVSGADDTLTETYSLSWAPSE